MYIWNGDDIIKQIHERYFRIPMLYVPPPPSPVLLSNYIDRSVIVRVEGRGTGRGRGRNREGEGGRNRERKGEIGREREGGTGRGREK